MQNTSIMIKISTQVASGECCCFFFSLCRGNMFSSAAECTLTCSCFLRIWCFFGRLQAAASVSGLGFYKRVFRRGQRGWDLQDFRKGLAGKGSEHGQPFGLRWPLSVHPQGMGVSIEYLKQLPDFYCVNSSLT